MRNLSPLYRCQDPLSSGRRPRRARAARFGGRQQTLLAGAGARLVPARPSLRDMLLLPTFDRPTLEPRLDGPAALKRRFLWRQAFSRKTVVASDATVRTDSRARAGHEQSKQV